MLQAIAFGVCDHERCCAPSWPPPAQHSRKEKGRCAPLNAGVRNTKARSLGKRTRSCCC